MGKYYDYYDPEAKPVRMNPRARDYLRRIGSKGGKKTGETKVRGGHDYYSAIARKRWAKPSD
jgi:hypothetical protein